MNIIARLVMTALATCFAHRIMQLASLAAFILSPRDVLGCSLRCCLRSSLGLTCALNSCCVRCLLLAPPLHGCRLRGGFLGLLFLWVHVALRFVPPALLGLLIVIVCLPASGVRLACPIPPALIRGFELLGLVPSGLLRGAIVVIIVP